jgi:hypothetical protein
MCVRGRRRTWCCALHALPPTKGKRVSVAELLVQESKAGEAPAAAVEAEAQKEST